MADLLTGFSTLHRASWHRQLRAAGCVNPTRELVAIASALGPHTDAVNQGVAQRAAGRPLAQVCGCASFCGLDLQVAPGTFVPRPRAQMLAGVAAETARRHGALLAVELGCGVGPIAAVLASRRPAMTTLACDLLDSGLDSARRNGRRYGFEVWQGDWWDALPTAYQGRIDLAVGYLPHVPDAQIAFLADESRWEDIRAFQGGDSGLTPLREVLAAAPKWLAPDSRFLTMVHRDQVDESLQIAHDAGYDARPVQASHDGHDVVIVTFDGP